MSANTNGDDVANVLRNSAYLPSMDTSIIANDFWKTLNAHHVDLSALPLSLGSSIFGSAQSIIDSTPPPWRMFDSLLTAPEKRRSIADSYQPIYDISYKAYNLGDTLNPLDEYLYKEVEVVKPTIARSTTAPNAEKDALLYTETLYNNTNTSTSTLVTSLLHNANRYGQKSSEIAKASSTPYVKILAPMVRYSKLPFRLLSRKWGADVAYTPMIIAQGFVSHSSARDSDFSVCVNDRPLVVQFAANNPAIFAKATETILPYADGVNLNCGCPQTWAMKSQLGAAMLKSPEIIYECIRSVRAFATIPVSIKIRLNYDIRKTVELVRQAEKTGASYITVHGRNAYELGAPVNKEAIALVKSNVSIPVIANGDLTTRSEMDAIVEETKVDGVMCARGALTNPALFANFKRAPLQCIVDYIHFALMYGERYSFHHHHLMYMLHPYLKRAERREFMQLRSLASVIEFFDQRQWWPADIYLSKECNKTVKDQRENSS